MNINFRQSKIWSDDTLYLVEAPTPADLSEVITCTYWGTVTSGAATATKRKKEVSSTVFPSGSVTVSGSTMTLKPFTAATAGKYVVTVKGTVSGNVTFKKFLIIVQKYTVER